MIGFEQTQVMARMWQIVNNNSILPSSVSWKTFWSTLIRYSLLSMKNILLMDGWAYQIGWIFRKVPKGGGGSFSTQKLRCRFWTFIKGFFGRFPKNIFFWKWGGGGGSKAVWNFSENSSVLVAWPVPQSFSFLTIWNFQGSLAAQYLHLQHQVVQSDRCFVQVGRPMDRHWEESSLQPGIIKNKTIKPWNTLRPS